MKGRIWIIRVASENFNITTFDHVAPRFFIAQIRSFYLCTF